MEKCNSQTRNKISSEVILCEKFKVIKKIGKGSFGVIYHGKNLQNDEDVAIKVEKPNIGPHLLYEAKVYGRLSGGVGIARVHYQGTHKNLNILVMDLLGPSLEDLFNHCNRHFSIKTLLMLSDQMICRLEYMHIKYFIHRDIKPQNFVMGTNQRRNILYIIDFGCAKKYYNPNTHIHIPYCENMSLIGTVRYVSINVHSGAEQSRRDDMESLGYLMIYFNRGRLPWQGIKANSRMQKREKIAELKISTTVKTLCKGIPEEFSKYLTYCRELEFNEKPDYMYLRQLFRDLSKKLNYETDYQYGWMLLKQKPQEDQQNEATSSKDSELPNKRAKIEE